MLCAAPPAAVAAAVVGVPHRYYNDEYEQPAYGVDEPFFAKDKPGRKHELVGLRAARVASLAAVPAGGGPGVSGGTTGVGIGLIAAYDLPAGTVLNEADAEIAWVVTR